MLASPKQTKTDHCALPSAAKDRSCPAATGEGGTYSVFAARDSSRAFATGCKSLALQHVVGYSVLMKALARVKRPLFVASRFASLQGIAAWSGSHLDSSACWPACLAVSQQWDAADLTAVTACQSHAGNFDDASASLSNLKEAEISSVFGWLDFYEKARFICILDNAVSLDKPCTPSGVAHDAWGSRGAGSDVLQLPEQG